MLKSGGARSPAVLLYTTYLQTLHRRHTYRPLLITLLLRIIRKKTDINWKVEYAVTRDAQYNCTKFHTCGIRKYDMSMLCFEITFE